MKHTNTWIIPANPNIYDHPSAFAKYGIITWALKINVDVGDTIYVRVSGPGAHTLYKCIAVKVGVPRTDMVGAEFWNEPFEYDEERQYVDLKLLDTTEDVGVSFKELQQHGLNGSHQAAHHLIDPLKAYIESFFRTTNGQKIEEIADSIATEDDLQNITSALKALSSQLPPKRIALIAQKIARNPKTARLVKESKQYVCEICNRKPFIQKNGKPYAEADHIEQLGGETRGLDTPENIRCLCAQCHAIVTYGSQEVINKLLSSTKWRS